MPKHLVFFKPDEVLCQFTDAAGRRTLAEFVAVPGVYAAGRLDYRSEGLLLLSDDGGLIHRVTDPRFEHPKTYWVQVEGIITAEAVERLNSEILLPGIQRCLPRAAALPEPDLPPRQRPVRAYHPASWLEVILVEGKKHLVRRLLAAVGFPVLRLVRVAIGEIRLGKLQPGEWRWLTAQEKESLYRQVHSDFTDNPKKIEERRRAWNAPSPCRRGS